MNSQVLPEQITRSIFVLRGQRVMLSTHLGSLYGVEPRALVQAVKRNIERFPPDFMFQLTRQEFASLKSQFVISSWGGLRRATPYAFTDQGVAMLSSVLRRKRAGTVNAAREARIPLTLRAPLRDVAGRRSSVVGRIGMPRPSTTADFLALDGATLLVELWRGAGRQR